MEGKANITIGQVNHIDKQKVSLSYYIGSFDNIQEAQIAKFAFDKVAEELGATIQDEACIMGENDTNLSKEEADKITLRIEEAAEKKEESEKIMKEADAVLETTASEPTPPTAI